MKAPIQFKTNIQCSGCLATVTPFLNNVSSIKEWKVDINNPDKVLTVIGEEITDEQVSAAVKAAGFHVERL